MGKIIFENKCLLVEDFVVFVVTNNGPLLKFESTKVIHRVARCLITAGYIRTKAWIKVFGKTIVVVMNNRLLTFKVNDSKKKVNKSQLNPPASKSGRLLGLLFFTQFK